MCPQQCFTGGATSGYDTDEEDMEDEEDVEGEDDMEDDDDDDKGWVSDEIDGAEVKVRPIREAVCLKLTGCEILSRAYS